MFTGIIEQTGTIIEVAQDGTNYSYWIDSPLSPELKPDQSVSHDGVCLTVEEIRGNSHRVTAVDETIKKTNLSGWKTGHKVNLERCMQMNGRLDGHIVQGHVDATATCIAKSEKNGSWEYIFSFDKKFSALIIEKGSVCLNGISLTVFNTTEDSFTVAIIPYTYSFTNLKNTLVGDKVNIEFDVIGKYVNKILQLR